LGSEKSSTKRWCEIDALRGLAVLLMVFSHALRWVYAGDPLNIMNIFGGLTPGDLATPMFYMAAGFSLYFSLHSQLQRSPDPLSVQKRYTRQLSKLFFIGVAMSLTWGVLQAQAITLLILVCFTIIMARLQLFHAMRILFPAIIVTALTAHLLITKIALPPLWEEILAGQFPLFAILAINASGFYLATYLQTTAFFPVITFMGVGLIGTILLLGERGAFIERYGASPSFLLLGIGLNCILLGIFHFQILQQTRFFKYLTLIGNDALFLFIFHYAAFFIPLHFAGFLGTMAVASALTFSVCVVTAVIITAKLRKNSTVMVYDLLDMCFVSAGVYLLRPYAYVQRFLTDRETPYPEVLRPYR
jgi:uncharacterized membrane protein